MSMLGASSCIFEETFTIRTGKLWLLCDSISIYRIQRQCSERCKHEDKSVNRHVFTSLAVCLRFGSNSMVKRNGPR